jgi:hypothetical protein
MSPDYVPLGGLSPKTYEEMVADICTVVATGDNVRVDQRRRFVGQSGQTHEIDVAVEVVLAELKYLTLIECKYWRKRVGLEEVMVLKQRIADIGAHKGVMVSASGFQKGAVTFAEANGIALVLCREQDKKTVVVRLREARTLDTDTGLLREKSKWGWLESPRMFSSKYIYGQVKGGDEVVVAELPWICNPLLLYAFLKRGGDRPTR